MLVAIHQPNFFPWLGYFNKLARADVFIVMDHVQFSKSGGNWMNRVSIIVNGHPQWLSVPITRAFHGYRSVRETRTETRVPWREKVLNTIRHSYRRSPYFNSVFPVLTELIHNSTDRLADYNLAALRALMSAFELDPEKMILGSTLGVNGHATDLLVDMVQAVGGTTYLCGGGAEGYQEDEKFASAGVGVVYQNFQHPTYQQTNTAQFIAGLSIIDALVNCGVSETSHMIRAVATGTVDSDPGGRG